MICLYEFKAQYHGEEYVTQREAAKDKHFDGLKQATKEAHEHLVIEINKNHPIGHSPHIVFSDPMFISSR